jgi:hypothetical protein
MELRAFSQGLGGAHFRQKANSLLCDLLDRGTFPFPLNLLLSLTGRLPIATTVDHFTTTNTIPHPHCQATLTPMKARSRGDECTSGGLDVSGGFQSGASAIHTFLISNTNVFALWSVEFHHHHSQITTHTMDLWITIPHRPQPWLRRQ